MMWTGRMITGLSIVGSSALLVVGCAIAPIGPNLNNQSSSGQNANLVNSASTRPTSDTQVKNIRGIIEGFYGTPWTHQERIQMFKFMQHEKLNTYVYAPKNDPYQRVDWRSHYPAVRFAQMKSLVSNASLHHVQFVYSISPGMTGTSNSDVRDSITYSSPADKRDLEAKIDQLQSIGVNTFMLSFDDIKTKLKPADRKVYAEDYPKAQMELANWILADEKAKNSNFHLWFAPTSYYGLTDGPYWQTLRSTLNPSIKVIWTGKWVLNKTISSAQAKRITRLLGRKPILWDNYPVNDYTYNPNKAHQLMMGPLQGRDSTLIDNVAGYISNPMLQPDASKLALETISDYLKSPGSYQPMAAWEKSIRNMPGITNPALFKIFAEYNSASTLHPSGYAPIGKMISAYWNASSSSQKQVAKKHLETEFRTLANLPRTLPPTITDRELLHEIQPWLIKLGEAGRGGLDALNEINQSSQSNEQLLKKQIKIIASSSYKVDGNMIHFMKKVENQR